MPRDLLTDQQVEEEIRRLVSSEYVSLAQKEQRLKLRRRKYMYDLRYLEKRGKELDSQGITIDNIALKMFAEDMDND